MLKRWLVVSVGFFIGSLLVYFIGNITFETVLLNTFLLSVGCFLTVLFQDFNKTSLIIMAAMFLSFCFLNVLWIFIFAGFCCGLYQLYLHKKKMS
jgi:hypothetical protein